MLSERNQITITDFGLARQKRSEYSKMTSMVGTLVYNCPEVIQNHPYGEKADVWSAGCILYLMCTLDPPFTCNNVLALATKIVEGVFKPISEKQFSTKLIAVANKCLTVKPEDRPDIVGVAREMVDVVMEYTDKLLNEQNEMEKRMIRDNQRFPMQTKFLQISDPNSSLNATISTSSSSRSKGDEKSLNADTSAGSKEKPMLNEEGGDVTGSFSADSKSSTSSDGAEKKLIPALINLPVKKISEVSDPVLKVLQQIRKLVYVSQTFSSGQELNAGRTLVTRYKSMLFSPNVTTSIVKSELCKLVNSSCQTVELLNSCPRLIHEAVHELHVHSLKVILEDATKDKPAPRESQLPTIITYDQLCTIIENLFRISTVQLQ